MAQADTTKSRGLAPEEMPLITYAQLKNTQSADVVLVDLRQSKAVAHVAGDVASASPLTDLQKEFPGAAVVHSPFETSPRNASAVAATPPLLVLIDNGDGSARNMARALKANGNTRFAILAGGEQILAVHGQAGLQRIGSSVTIHKSSGASPTSRP
jgi:hypothetical protein